MYRFNKKMSGIVVLLMFLLSACGSAPVSGQSAGSRAEAASEISTPTAQPEHLTREDWADDVKTAVNDLIDMYGRNSDNYSGDSYVVFDFDNTIAVFDVQIQQGIYQLQTMSFAVTPDSLPAILLSEIGDPAAPRPCFSEDGAEHCYNDWVADISAAYRQLYDRYGPFSAEGVETPRLKELHADPYWREFAAKMYGLWNVVNASEPEDVYYLWAYYWCTGMTEEEVYNLSRASHAYYRGVDTSREVWSTDPSVASIVGEVRAEWTSGIQVTDNLREMMRVLSDNGFDVWICTASPADVVRAGIDEFMLHDCVTGMIGMTIKQEDGVFINEYDYEDACGWYARENGSWERTEYPLKTQTVMEGKLTGINNAIAPLYNNAAPLAGFGDSTGDFNFCTEYSDMKLVVFFNRADRKVTDGGGLISEVAIYERDTLGYDLEKANAAGDTLYVLQGRNENGKRTLINSNETIRLGESESRLFANEDNHTQLQYMMDNSMTVREAFDTFAVCRAADESRNVLGFSYGFLQEYDGYHSK